MVIAKCEKCKKEYQLESNEKPSDFQCECGGGLDNVNELSKPKENETGISKLINWKAIIVGAVSYFLLMLVVIVVSFEIYNADNTSLLEYVFMMSISGIITGYISGKEYLSGITNSLIIVVSYSIIMGLFGGLIAGFGWLIGLTVFGVIGGLIGVVIYRKYNNYNLINSYDSTWKRSLGAWLGVLGIFTYFFININYLAFLIFILVIIIYKSYYKEEYMVF